MGPVFCFIDDAPFELHNFRQHAAPAFAPVRLVYASTFAQCQEKLGQAKPLLFLLDIYGTSPDIPQGDIPSQAELTAALGPEAPLAELYEGLQGQEKGEAVNAFLRRLYGRVQGWQSAFLSAAGAVGQGPAYGLANLAAAKKSFPWAVCLGYSRKAMFSDASAFTLAGGDGVLQKPQGADSKAIAAATREAAPTLARACFGRVNQRLAGLAARAGLRLAARQETELSQALSAAGQASAAAQDALPRAADPALAAALARALEKADLSQSDRDFMRAIHSWLSPG